MEKKFKIYTKVGDFGDTFTLGGLRVRKDDLRIEAYGEIDELTSWIGVVISHLDEIGDNEEVSRIRNFLISIQNKLFDTGTLVIGMELEEVGSWAEEIEKEIDYIEEKLPSLHKFILPIGSKVSSFTHIARCVCRRAERRVVELSSLIDIDVGIIKFLNRLSDYLFVLSRYLNYLAGIGDTLRDESIYVSKKIKIKVKRENITDEGI